MAVLFFRKTDDFKLEGDLRRIVSLNIKRLIDINSVRGRRHLKGLPVRGQRTRTNANTQRSKRRKKEELDKLGEKNRKS